MFKISCQPVFRLAYFVRHYCTNRRNASINSLIELNSKIKQLYHDGKYQQVVDIVNQRVEICNSYSIGAAIHACTKLRDRKRGSSIHKRLPADVRCNPFVQTSLIGFHMQCDDIETAHLFESITNKSNYMYTAMFKGLTSNGMYVKVLDLFDEMKIQPDNFTLSLLFKACSEVGSKRAMTIGKNLISKITYGDRSTEGALNAAIHMFLKFGDIHDAEQYFKLMTPKNLITYGAILKSFIDKRMAEKALDLFEEMDIKPNNIIYTLIFSACGQLDNDRARRIGRELVHRVLTGGEHDDRTLTSIIGMLGKFNDVNDLERIFRLICHKTSVTYGIIMKVFADHGMGGRVLDLFEEMNSEPNDIIRTIVLNACADVCDNRAKAIGRKLVDDILDKNSQNDFNFGSAIGMLGKFGDVERAKRVFDRIEKPSVFTYCAMMKVWNENDMAEETLDLFERMHVEPDNIIRTVVLSACAQLCNERAKTIGRKLIDEILADDNQNDFNLNTAISMCGKFGDIDTAERLFNTIRNPTVRTLGVVMKVYNENGMAERTLDLFERIPMESNNFIRTHVLNGCSQLCNERAKTIGRRLANDIVAKNNPDEYNVSATISMFGKFHDIQNAELAFETIQNATVANYGAMMKLYNENNMAERALDLFKEMTPEPNDIIHILALSACSQLCNERAKTIGRKIVDEIVAKQNQSDFNVNTAISMCGNFGDIENAERLFNMIRNRTVGTYGAMMKVYSENDMVERAIDLFEKMDVNPDNIIFTIIFGACAQLDNDRTKVIGQNLLHRIPEQYRHNSSLLGAAMHMLMRRRDVKNAEQIFNSIQEKTSRTYGALMSGYNFNGEPEKCFKAFEEMRKQNIPLDEVISMILIDACSQLGMIRRCEYVIDMIPEQIRNRIRVKTAIIGMWAKCGFVERAKQLFYSMSDRDTVTYNTMINGLGLNGMGSEAFELYTQMPIHLRSEVTYTCILNACSHSGLYREAKTIFDEISHKTEKITTAMVDCLSRLFLFDEAQDLIKKYEETNPPNFVMYMSLLSGLRNNRNRTMSEKVLQRMTSLFPDNKEGLMPAAILVSNIYSSLGQHRRANDLRSQYKKELKTNVKQRLSWTEVNGSIEKFCAHDRSHHLSAEIYAEIDRMTSEVKQHGYRFDSSWITRSLKQGETTESALCGHSEKLAIAFNFIQQPIPEFIQVTKNLRVCGDCHEFTKRIAKIRQRDIIVRDANRIHQFQQSGQCSCQDHF